MKLLVVGEDGPGAIVHSLLPGLAMVADVTRSSGADRSLLGESRTVRRVVGHRREAKNADARFVETVRQLQPDAVLVIKGRCLTGRVVTEVRRSGTPVVIYYPDNPYWRGGDTGSAIARLEAANLAIVWSERIAAMLRPTSSRVAVVPFGYDDRWYPPTSPEYGYRYGVAFIGTWSRRRERYLSALAGLPLVVHGSAWEDSPIPAASAVYGPEAGEVLKRALIGVNLLHPQNAGAHNMRTREIVASGAAQVTDPGTDGTPLRDDESCLWLRSPQHLRAQVMRLLEQPRQAAQLATMAQSQAGTETYAQRGELIGRLITSVTGH